MSCEVPYAPAYREGHEDLGGNLLDHVDDRLSRFMGRGDVEEAELVRHLLLVCLGVLHRPARVLQVDEIHPLYHPAFHHVEAGDDPLSQHTAMASSTRYPPFIERLAHDGGPDVQLLQALQVVGARSRRRSR